MHAVVEDFAVLYNIVRRLSAVRKVVTVKIVGRFENVATGKGEAAAVF